MKTALRPASPRPPRHRRARRVLLAMDYYLGQAHQGVVGYARQVGWILDSRTQNYGALPPDWQADGILTFIGSSDRFGPALRASGLPMVNMSPWRPELNIPTVHMDNVEAGRMAADHLIGRCLDHLAMVQFTASSVTSAARRKGFESTVLAANRTFYPLVANDPSQDGTPTVIAAVAEQIRKLPKPLGILTEGDGWAVELIHICQQMNMNVPEDVAILGVDNDPMVVDVAPVSVSSVDNNLYGLGYEAAHLLDRLLDGETPPEQPILIPPVGVVQRASTSMLAATHDEVAAALLFIHQHFRQPISVADVAAELTISRRRLQDLFLRHVGRTVAQEITRHRLNLAKQMLHESQIKVGLIAERCGFGSHVRLAKVFARVLKCTPKEFRQQHATRALERPAPKARRGRSSGARN